MVRTTHRLIKSNAQENEDFLTPLEHHNSWSSSLQEGPQWLREVTAFVSKVTVSVDTKTTAGNEEHVKDEASIDFETREINLGFSSETEKIDTCDKVLG